MQYTDKCQEEQQTPSNLLDILILEGEIKVMVRHQYDEDDSETKISQNSIWTSPFQIKGHDHQYNPQEDESVLVKAFFHSKCIIAHKFQRVVEKLDVDILSNHYNKSYENKDKSDKSEELLLRLGFVLLGHEDDH